MKISAIPVSILLFFTFACSQTVKMDLNEQAVIPKPAQQVASHNSFALGVNTSIVFDARNVEIEPVASMLSLAIKEDTGLEIALNETGWFKKEIYLKLEEIPDISDKEAYQLRIDEKQITLSANAPEGLFRGIQTLRQIITKGENSWLIPGGTITDYPEYAYRGTMLDVSRHFFGPEIVKQYIDYIAYYKLNHLHLHLSDDQGWRIEIKKWPKLTEIGGSTEVGGGEGGYFTQEEFIDLVKYADERYITIVPEIDMPGHTNAALASYPELNCDGIARNLYTGTRVGFSTLCTDKEITYEFVNDVVGEISAMITGPYFHIGGDESHVTPLEDYIPFVNRVQKIVRSHNKVMIGWDEIAHADLDADNIVQFWRHDKITRMGIDKGAKVLMAPAKRTYLDMKYDSTSELGLDWAAHIEIDRAYNWDPDNYREGIERKNIIGIESPLWAETIETLDDIEFLAFPRLVAHAEIGWTTSELRIWDDFKQRLAAHGPKMKALGIDYYESPLIDWEKGE